MLVKMYHERQSRQMCLVHALNALFQKPQFTAESLDTICYSLNDSRWFNPHRSMIGLGNYDANVLMSALALHDYQVFNVLQIVQFFFNVPSFVPLLLLPFLVVWFDGRLPVERICFENIDALIVNVPSKNFIPFWKGRHWYTILRQQDSNKFFNLDSKLTTPQEVPDITQYCRSLLMNTAEANQLFLVLSLEVHRSILFWNLCVGINET
ncbi:hypothetical protein Q1695_001113 [Nippostrongylus brasiliensis]|nr:hypothetical protein Q1695_001113 [Nippostrongylus brasiliensis]